MEQKNWLLATLERWLAYRYMFGLKWTWKDSSRAVLHEWLFYSFWNFHNYWFISIKNIDWSSWVGISLSFTPIFVLTWSSTIKKGNFCLSCVTWKVWIWSKHIDNSIYYLGNIKNLHCITLISSKSSIVIILQQANYATLLIGFDCKLIKKNLRIIFSAGAPVYFPQY